MTMVRAVPHSWLISGCTSKDTHDIRVEFISEVGEESEGGTIVTTTSGIHYSVGMSRSVIIALIEMNQ